MVGPLTGQTGKVSNGGAGRDGRASAWRGRMRNGGAKATLDRARDRGGNGAVASVAAG